MLNREQQRAVETVEGRVLVLAGAGTGKTRVIVHRIAHLIQKCHVTPESILGLTFTNKAAAEMRERVAALIGKEAGERVTLSTFHSFCMHLLRREIDLLGYTRHFSLYDEGDLDRLVKQIAREMLGCTGELPSLGATKAALAEASYRGGSHERYTWHDKFSQELYGRLQSTLRAHNAVSFDHLISLTIQLFEKDAAVLEKYQERYRYLMIDEYQDTNPAQFRLAELLSSKYGNLCVVGDDDQSIYGWRGAEVSNILQFQRSCTVKLEQNYRSTPAILDAANGVIQHNKNRHDKRLWSEGERGELVEIFHAPSEAEEAQAVIARILHYKQELRLRWKDFAILYRSNALSRQFEVALLNASWQKEGQWVRAIPYEVFGGLEFSERSEIKDILSYLRALANPLDQEALLRILNVPRRGISDQFLDALTQKQREEKLSLWQMLEEIGQEKRPFPNHPRGVAGVRSFVSLMQKAKRRFEEGKLGEGLAWFLEEIQYKKAIEEEVKSDKMRTFKWENAAEFINTLTQFEETVPPEDATLQQFVSQTALGKPQFASSDSLKDQVQLMTLHSAKGLEFPICFIVGLEDHILPHAKSLKQTGIEEERRLFYVGITRARKKLVLSMARSRMQMGKVEPTTPSRFLYEIPKHTLKSVHAKDLYSPSPT